MQSSIDLRAPFSYNIIPIIIGIIFIIIISIYFFVKNKSKNEKIIGIDKRKELGELNIKEIKKKYINKLDKLKLSVENENIGLREGYQTLSSIIRYFVYDVTNIKVQNYTLEEVRKLDIKYLPELMEEYYRPEFAKESLGNIQNSINNAKGVIEKWS